MKEEAQDLAGRDGDARAAEQGDGGRARGALVERRDDVLELGFEEGVAPGGLGGETPQQLRVQRADYGGEGRGR